MRQGAHFVATTGRNQSGKKPRRINQAVRLAHKGVLISVHGKGCHATACLVMKVERRCKGSGTANFNRASAAEGKLSCYDQQLRRVRCDPIR